MKLLFPILIITVNSTDPRVHFRTADCDCCGSCGAITSWDGVESCQPLVPPSCSIYVNWELKVDHCSTKDATLLNTGGVLLFAGTHELKVEEITIKWENMLLPDGTVTNSCTKMIRGVTEGAQFVTGICKNGVAPPTLESNILKEFTVEPSADQGVIVQLIDDLGKFCLIDRKKMTISTIEEIVGNGAEPETTTPEIETTTPEVETTTPEVETTTPEVETTTPEAETTTPEVETTTPEVETTTREVETTTPEVGTSALEVETTGGSPVGQTTLEESNEYEGVTSNMGLGAFILYAAYLLI
eukprot:Gregarina_sp_Poly_1__5894@NODE_3101_length_1384_cov_573_335611_g1965_i0_p1_GENE_NODE_3101_length_1384_cov_573_335611_g1965_i0NODE_3101_length_1384_cov_573_335611_g1965_i0_p1_ORF_typecomplete_len300_score18_82Mucin/PF01456_17/0_00048Herpes_BLLF1/PF05109_13/1_5e04Herpes_BLLF1/PF05109_13/0_00058WEMBL/PF05701_11/0_042CENPF_leu_zip/PF10473_9/0_093Podoplanin/PF05808_11/0_4_NODE_3101_length_1384_cov_573_335611_g1965_i02281127